MGVTWCHSELVADPGFGHSNHPYNDTLFLRGHVGPRNKQLLRLEDAPRNTTEVMPRKEHPVSDHARAFKAEGEVQRLWTGMVWGGWAAPIWRPVVSGKHVSSAMFLTSCGTCRPFPTILLLALEFGTWRGTVCRQG